MPRMFIAFSLLIIFLTSALAAEAENASDLELVILAKNWCGYCKAMKKDLKEHGVFPSDADLNLAEPPLGHLRLKFLGVGYDVPVRIFNLDLMTPQEENELAAKYGGEVLGVPDSRVFFGKKLVGKQMGQMSVEELSELFEKVRMKNLLEFGNLRPFLESTETESRSNGLPLAQISNDSTLALFLGSTSKFDNNPIFISQVLADTRSTLMQHGLASDSILTLYGSGEKGGTPTVVGRTRNDSPIKGDPLDVGNSVSGTRASILALIKRLQQTAPRNLLLFVVGHGSEEGSLLWHENELSPDELKLYLQAMGKAGNQVIVNGTCHSGVFALKASCGFYAARPERIASGCYEHTEARANRTDYATKFFDALDAPKESDFDRNGGITFAEAHWFAVLTGYSKDAPYTDLDSLSDRILEHYSDSNNIREIYKLNVGDVIKLGRFGTEQEQRVLLKLLLDNSFPRGELVKEVWVPLIIPNRAKYLDEELVVKREAGKKLLGLAWEEDRLSKVSGVKLVSLARRLLARKILAEAKSSRFLDKVKEEWSLVEKCENQSIRSFLAGH